MFPYYPITDGPPLRFKVTFADEQDTLFLRKSLEALIPLPNPIREVYFSRNEFSGVTKDSRSGLYDLVCEDEQGNTFIVEMQLGYYPHYMQRAIFYAFQKFNTTVEKGKYFFDNLTPIYCIGFLAHNIFPSEHYYHYGTLQNQFGETMDTQIVHIIVEIRKFKKTKEQVQDDLDKLIYTMKNADRMHKEEEKKQAALELLQNGVSVDVIAKSLHLSPEFIRNLSQP